MTLPVSSHLVSVRITTVAFWKETTITFLAGFYPLEPWFGVEVSVWDSDHLPEIPLSCLHVATKTSTSLWWCVFTHPCCHYTLTSSRRDSYLPAVSYYHVLVLPWMMLKLVSDTRGVMETFRTSSIRAVFKGSVRVLQWSFDFVLITPACSCVSSQFCLRICLRLV